MKNLFAATLLGFLTSVSLGCGSDSDSGTPMGSGVSGSKTLANLTPAEQGQICDWQAGLEGGYGKSATCSDGSTINNYETRADCVADAPSCTATVAQLEACAKVVLVVPLCEQIAKLISSPQCQPLAVCF